MAYLPPGDQTIPTTPQGALGLAPCVQCASESVLLQALLLVLAYRNADDLNLPLLFANAKSWETLSDKQLLEAIVNVLAEQIIGNGLTPTEIADALACLKCRPPKAIKAAIAYEIAKLAKNNFAAQVR